MAKGQDTTIELNFTPSTREIPLTRGKVAIVDAADYDWLMQWKWCVSSAGYANRGHTKSLNKRILKLMHREIMNCPDGMEVDHINGNPLDNRRCNLRICTHQQNMRNTNKRQCRALTSQYKGVWLDKRRNTWNARVRANGETLHLGRFQSEEEAARAYDKTARRHFGEFAKLNFPEEAAP